MHCGVQVHREGNKSGISQYVPLIARYLNCFIYFRVEIDFGIFTQCLTVDLGIPIPCHILFLGEWGIGESGFYIPRGIEE